MRISPIKILGLFFTALAVYCAIDWLKQSYPNEPTYICLSLMCLIAVCYIFFKIIKKI